MMGLVCSALCHLVPAGPSPDMADKELKYGILFTGRPQISWPDGQSAYTILHWKSPTQSHRNVLFR